MKNSAVAVLFVTICCLIVIPCGCVDGDWETTTGSATSPWITTVGTPTDGIRVLWSESGEVTDEGMTWTDVPGLPITVGDYTYYVKCHGTTATLYKVTTVDNGSVCSVGYTTDTMFTTHITYGDGKIFVPAFDNGDDRVEGDETISLKSFNATDLVDTGISYPNVSGGNGSQCAITYHNGNIYYGTYSGEYVIVDANTGELKWTTSGETGWYNMYPTFVTIGSADYCVISSKGYHTENGSNVSNDSTIYVVDLSSFTVTDTEDLADQMVTAGGTYYEGRVYFSSTAVLINGSLKTHIDSFTIDSNGLLSDKKSWISAYTGGTQSSPVIYNDRIYIGSGGEVVMGTGGRPVEVISIGTDDVMSSIYAIDALKTKCTLTLSTAYATPQNGYTVYLYAIPYCSKETGSTARDLNDFFIIRDSQNTTSADVKTFNLGITQYAYQSVCVTDEGYLFVSTDDQLICLSSCEGVIGDINNDGKIKPADALYILQKCAGMRTFSARQTDCGDVSGDGKVKPVDALYILQYLANLRSNLLIK